MADSPSDDDLLEQLRAICEVIAKRARTEKVLDAYYEGTDLPIPRAVRQAKVTKAYRTLMGVTQTPWASLVVDSVTDRLRITGINSGDKDIDKALWSVWQRNKMDSDARLIFNSSLANGRCFGLVWPDEDDNPEISLDTMGQMCIQYAPGSRRKRVAAVRYWIEGKRAYATLYRPEALYKYVSREQFDGGSLSDIYWVPRDSDEGEWQVDNPFNVVPVVELAVNRRLKSGQYGYARGEFEHVTGLIDRIHILSFVGMVVALYMGFPLRGVIGEKMRREVLLDNQGNPIIDEETGKRLYKQLPLFDAQVGGQFQLENPQAKLAEYAAADRRMLSIYPELNELASVTQTPAHYFPMEQGMSNIGADAMFANEATLIGKIPRHQDTLGEGVEEILRLSGLMLPEEIELPESAELTWADHEFRTKTEQADAASKLKDVLPQYAVIEYALNATSDQIARWQAMEATNGIGRLLNTMGDVPEVPRTPIEAASLNGAT